MERGCLLAFLLILQTVTTTQASLTVGGGVGVGIGIGSKGGGAGGGGGVGAGGGVWIGGGSNHPKPPSVSNLKNAYTALQAWKSAISDDPFRILDSWVGADVCAYKGVFCVDPQDALRESSEPVVAGVDLNHANLKGTLVKELCLLSDLSLLHLNSNRFTGTVPDTFKHLFSLVELDLSNNHFSGSFPTPPLLIPNLIYLDLRFNNFSGPIPEDLFNKKLDAIFLNNNQFGGELPSNLGNSPASVMNFANNEFSGNIPFSFGYIGPRLKEIIFLNNRLNGCIPDGVGLWQDLKVLDASFNSLVGQLPDSVSCLSEIEVLNLAHNELSGVLPDLVCSLESLENLSVAYNFFSGISRECPGRNVCLDITANCIPGKNMQRPEPECSAVPGEGLNCLRIPGANPLVCGPGAETQETTSSSSSSP